LKMAGALEFVHVLKTLGEQGVFAPKVVRKEFL